MPWPKSTKAVRVPKANLHSANCPTRLILDDVMSRWGSLVLVLLLERSYRFSELAYLIGGVSEKMLSQTLRRLEVDGFVRREVHATKPPKVEYSLTPLGCELGKHVQSLLSFVHKNASRVLKNRDNAKEREAG
ncbi:helix-turn-helix domain-containing protein [Granulicella sp. S156]|jgi:DNA-binding HxlR family transcriptional regulator|uniref:winged helix-turn-helix transcriptional regulator n=1 Tax=Granulicella sp. S156 TaxID=1747224 RepID=UPI00131DE04B|nr:helix-turn-helix domain-containing protein [Granulicella sp. S156]